MRKGMMLGAAALSAALIAGCGGSSDSTPTTVSRVLVGYVYVTKNNGGTYTGPSAFILPSNNLSVMDPTPASPNSGDEVPLDKPTSGTIRLAVNGSLTKAIDTMDFDLADSNEIICLAKGTPSDTVDVEALVADPIMNGTVAKTLSVPIVNLGSLATTNTVLGMQSPSTPTYVAGPADEIRLKLQTTVGAGGTATLGTFVAPGVMMASNGTGLGAGFVAGQVYNVAAAVFDSNGIVITGASTVLTSSDARVVAAGTTLTPALGLGAGDVVITATIAGQALVTETFHGAYSQGASSSVVVTPAGPTALLWAAAGVEATQTLTATVRNEVGALVIGGIVNFSCNKETSAASNDWNTGAFDSVTAVFTPNTGSTNASGQLATVVTAPTSTGALAAGNTAKGLATVTAQSASATGTATLNITRPLGTVSITGPTRMDVGTVSPATHLTDPTKYFHVTGAADIDGDTVTAPAVTWTILNTAIGGNTVGNVGDTSPRSLSVATIDASTGIVTAGAVAGQATVTVTAAGSPTVTPIVTEIHGAPAKMILSPVTVASVIGGATGEYAAAAGTVLPFSFTLQDAFGHNVAFTELNALTTTSSIQSITGGTISQGGLNVHSFSLTFGSGDGTFDIGTGPITWTGTAGGTATLIGGITRSVGHNGS